MQSSRSRGFQDAPQNLGHAGEVHAHAEGPVATELVEAVSPQVDRHQRHVGVVHGLQLDAGVATVPGGLVQEILQRLQHLLKEISLDKPGLKHFDSYWVSSLL